MPMSAPAAAIGGEKVAERIYPSRSLARAVRDAEALASLDFDVELTTRVSLTVTDSVLREYRLRAWKRPDDRATRVAVHACNLVTDDPPPFSPDLDLIGDAERAQGVQS